MFLKDKQLVIIFIIAFLGTVNGCATSNMPDQMRNEIPEEATTVELTSDMAADDLYRNAYRMLRQEGFRFSETNEEMRDLSTEGTKTGNSQVDLRIDLFVDAADDGSGSVLTATAEYELTPDNWRPVAFKDSGTKYKIGFEELVLLMSKLENTDISYIVDENRADRAFGIN